MTFEVLENTPEVAPLLVRLYDTHGLYALAEDKTSGESCAELTSIMADLLSIPLKPVESELITDVLLALMKKAETDLRAALAERLSTMENAPLRIILGLAGDEIRVAEPVLRKSSVLHDLDLLYILKAKGLTHGRVMAQRNGIGAGLIDALAETRDFEIAVNLSGNDGVALTAHAYSIFVSMAETSPDLARPMASRHDLPLEIGQKMMTFIGEELKASLVRKFGAEAQPLLGKVSEVASELYDQDAGSDRLDQLVDHARAQKKSGALTASVLIGTLRRGQRAAFLAQLAVFAEISPSRTKSFVISADGREFSMLCKAVHIGKADFVSLYLLTERFRGAQKKMVGHAELSRIMNMYDAIDMEQARALIRKARD